MRFARRPLELLAEWHARYGDLFTVRMTGFGTGVYVVDPDAIQHGVEVEVLGAAVASTRPAPDRVRA